VEGACVSKGDVMSVGERQRKNSRVHLVKYEAREGLPSVVFVRDPDVSGEEDEVEGNCDLLLLI
jgi:N-dimethylarginine dimethylaminohydrolase